MEMEWIKVEDKLPEDNNDVFMCSSFTDEYYTGWYDGEKWVIKYDYNDESGLITHWMPIPERR